MTPQRARTYLWLVGALAASVLVNLMLLQPDSRGARTAAAGKQSAAGGPDATAQLARAASSHGEVPTRAAQSEVETVRAVQRELKLAGYYPGQVDGRASYLTHAAIFAFERENGLLLTGEPSQGLLKALILGAGRRTGSNRVPSIVRGSAAERLVRDVKVKLNDLGYAAGNSDGRVTAQMIGAIRAFERDNGLQPTGDISAGLLMHLYRSTAAFRPASD